MTDSRPFVVLKYGGTSVATPERWRGIAARVRELLPDHRVWLVTSALSQVSNQLEAAIEQALARDAADPATRVPTPVATPSWRRPRERASAFAMAAPSPDPDRDAMLFGKVALNWRLITRHEARQLKKIQRKQ